MPFVSVLVPIYNVEKYIERCARSLFEQTFEDIEYIFVNDCTPDRSVEILKQILEDYPLRKSQVTIIDHPCNCGIGQVRMTALSAANGKYIWHVDSDDCVATDAVAKLVDTAMENDADFVTFSYSDVFADGRQIERIRNAQEKVKFCCGMLSGKNLPYLHKIFVKKELYTDNGIYPVPGVNYGEDYALTPRLLFCSKKLVFLPDVLYFYHHANSESYCSVWKKSYIEQQIIAHTALRKFFADRAAEMLPFIDLKAIKAKCHFYRMWALDKNSTSADLSEINKWRSDIPFLTVLKKAALPYKPLVFLGYCKQVVLMRLYARFARFVRNLLMKIFSRTSSR